MLQYFILIFTAVAITSQSFGESVEQQTIEVLLKDLQEEMNELRRIREQDSRTILKLQEEVYHHITKDNRETSLVTNKEFPEHFDDMAKDDSSKKMETINYDGKSLSGSPLRHFIHQFPISKLPVGSVKPDMKHETNFLRQEVLRLSKEMAELKLHASDGISMSSGKVAVRWLQNTVEGIRHEMKEMALSLNTSATLAEKQKIFTNLGLLRSDISGLEHRMDSVRVDREKNTAVIHQLRRDVDELRLRVQESAASQQRILVEVDSLKEELREHVLMSRKKDSIFDDDDSTFKHKGASHKLGGRDHPKFRHGQWKYEVENLHQSVVNLEYIQTEIGEKLRNLQKSQALSDLKLTDLEKAYDISKNRSEPADVENRIFNQRLDILESLMNRTELQTLDIQSKINNITSTGIKKLHGSTMQLFSALERLERNYDQSTEDIRRDISKLDFNFSQTQSNLEDLSDRQISSEQVISNLKNDLTTVQSDLTSDHLRLLLVQNAVLNRSYEFSNKNTLISHDSRILNLESKIHSLSTDVEAEKQEIEELHRQVVEKVDDKDFSKWEKSQRKIRESILQFKEDIPQLKEHQEGMEEELEKFIHQLPQDCSGNSTFERFSEHNSGVYLIRSPIDELKGSAVKVFCDMDTSGGQWTLIQRRVKGDQDFGKAWDQYKHGFGNIDFGDFWIGNELLHKLTTKDKYVLRLDLWDSAGKYKYAEYNTFEVLDEIDNYRLVIAGYNGNASDAFNYHNGMAFSTPDKDNDASDGTHCAQFYNSGWWYNDCQYVNINGKFNQGITWYDIDGKEWSELSKVEMKIRLRTVDILLT